MTAPDIDEAVRAMTNDEIETATCWAERALSRHFPQPCECSECTMGRAIMSLVADNKRLHASREAEAKVVEAAMALFLDAKETYAYADDPGYSANRIKRDLSAVDDLIRLRAGKEKPDAK